MYAPNVHTGGGLVLLNALLGAWPVGQPFVAWLDRRAQHLLSLPDGCEVVWVEASFSSRLAAEKSLVGTSKEGDTVLCFHGLPPLLPSPAKIVLFQQNRIHLGQVDLKRFALRTRMRLWGEQVVSKAFRKRVTTYWVQTPSMARALEAWYGNGPVDIRVLPFAAPFQQLLTASERKFDFVYVADGEAHKNHQTLVRAWILLKKRGLSPRLALTLSQRDTGLKQWVADQTAEHGLRIDDVGVVPHAEVPLLYRQAGALIFPSLSESFGLPLIEASALGLPILAGELDFVRDVCMPAETFDPFSAVSIERAVLRHMGKADIPELPASAENFLRKVMA